MRTNPVDVLLVEDNDDDAELTIRELKRHHFANNIFHAKNGEEALKWLFCDCKSSSPPGQDLPKVILLDIHMPKVDGLEVLEKMKADKQIKLVPVVMLTSSSLDPDIYKCYDLGASSYIVKPLNFERFSDAIRSLGFYWLLLTHPPIK